MIFDSNHRSLPLQTSHYNYKISLTQYPFRIRFYDRIGLTIKFLMPLRERKLKLD